MKDNHKPTNERPEPEAPKGLRDDLAAIYAADVPVPAEVDRAVLTMARRRVTRRRRHKLAFRWAAGVAAAAAVVMFAVFVTGPERDRDTLTLVAAREDVDRDGRVDILDAFVLAKHVEAGRKPVARWDFNGDGRVDRADVDTVAMAAVKLNGGAL